jgi:hypothetical protein
MKRRKIYSMMREVTVAVLISDKEDIIMENVRDQGSA